MSLRRLVHGEETDRERQRREQRKQMEKQNNKGGPLDVAMKITDYLGR
jgi:hypothetical protein